MNDPTKTITQFPIEFPKDYPKSSGDPAADFLEKRMRDIEVALEVFSKLAGEALAGRATAIFQVLTQYITVLVDLLNNSKDAREIMASLEDLLSSAKQFQREADVIHERALILKSQSLKYQPLVLIVIAPMLADPSIVSQLKDKQDAIRKHGEEAYMELSRVVNEFTEKEKQLKASLEEAIALLTAKIDELTEEERKYWAWASVISRHRDFKFDIDECFSNARKSITQSLSVLTEVAKTLLLSSPSST